MQFTPWGMGIVLKMFPESASRKNVVRYFPVVESALNASGILEPRLKVFAYATIRAESASFRPIPEEACKLNTMKAPDVSAISNQSLMGIASIHNAIVKQYGFDDKFGRYNYRMGNDARGMAEKYKGRGFIQLTGRNNYLHMSKTLPLPGLLDHPDLALEPGVAARILAAYIKTSLKKIEAALSCGDLNKARALVNGGTHGMAHFSEAYHIGIRHALPHDSGRTDHMA
jgi:predicted chitinase